MPPQDQVQPPSEQPAANTGPLPGVNPPNTVPPNDPVVVGSVVQPGANAPEPIAPANPAPSVSVPAVPQPVNQSVYPQQPTAIPTTQTTSPNDPYAGLTGSQLPQKKQPIPIGVYVIAGFILISFIVSFFDTSQNSALYTIIMFADLLLAIGLLLRLEVARKIIVWAEGITIVLVVVSLFMLVGLQQRIDTLKTNYDNAISKIDQNRLTSAQKKLLADMNAAIAAKEKEAGKAITFSYIKLGVSGAATIGIIVYLTRPKVKAAFHELEP